MDSIIINRPIDLKGTVKISGSKNASLPIICTSLLCKKTILKNVPDISDVRCLLRIIRYLGCKVKFKKNILIIDTTGIKYKSLNIDDCKRLRASYYLIPIMLYLFNRCEIAYPGGCAIGDRPIDLHIDAIKEFGYIVEDNGALLKIHEDKYKVEKRYTLKGKSVGASINTILLGLKGKYVVIDNLLLEPEGLAVCRFLFLIGFNISYLSSKAVIKGVNTINSIKYNIIPDRIEALSYICLGLLCGKIKIKNINLHQIRYPLDLLIRAGYKIIIKNSCVIVKKSRGAIFSFKTDIYPFIPTDIQPILGALFAYGRGSCKIEESIFSNRMQIYKDISMAGGNVNIIGNKAYISGGNNLERKSYSACDLRHGMAVLMLALKSGGEVNNFNYIERGYENIIKKLTRLGAKIKIK